MSLMNFQSSAGIRPFVTIEPVTLRDRDDTSPTKLERAFERGEMIPVGSNVNYERPRDLDSEDSDSPMEEVECDNTAQGRLHRVPRNEPIRGWSMATLRETVNEPCLEIPVPPQMGDFREMQTDWLSDGAENQRPPTVSATPSSAVPPWAQVTAASVSTGDFVQIFAGTGSAAGSSVTEIEGSQRTSALRMLREQMRRVSR